MTETMDTNGQCHIDTQDTESQTDSTQTDTESQEQNDNPFDLSPEEQRVLRFWQKGETMVDAYKRVMLSIYDAQAISKPALAKRVSRFFNNYRMREAMAATPGERGEQARRDMEKWKRMQADGVVDKAIMSKLPEKGRVIKELRKYGNIDVVELEEKQRKEKEQKLLQSRNKWIESLEISEEPPTAFTIYGAGRMLFKEAFAEMLARKAEIKRSGISVLDKNGSAFTANIIKAIQAAAALTIPYAPPPTAEDRREMSKIAVMLGLMPETIQELPEDYAAPPPVTIDIDATEKDTESSDEQDPEEYSD